MNNARITAITIDSKYSRTVDFLNSAIPPPLAHRRASYGETRQSAEDATAVAISHQP
jgi:hypothetical protein